MRTLYWFRSDLRLADNLALADAMANATHLMGVFILTPTTWQSHSAAPRKIQFLLQNLKTLSESLYEKGIPLIILHEETFSDCPAALDRLCREHTIEALYFNHEYPWDEAQRDEAVIRTLSKKVEIKTYHQQLVLRPGAVLSQQKASFQIFTPFKKVWLAKAEEQQVWRAQGVPAQTFETALSPDVIPDQLDEFSSQTLSDVWLPGEKAAHKKLKEFCENRIDRYQKDRDVPELNGTSVLSPYLALGVLSPRQCISAAMDACDISYLDSLQKNPGAATWISELIWRDFYHHIVFFHPDVCRHKPFRVNTDNIPWRSDVSLLEAWKNGRTGFPIVDAGMRQLLQTGWMHNRLRMVTAMFLSKILLLDWRLGEKHFMEQLIDGDFAANNGGWQWSASTGTDAVPYFRIFNPTTQSQRFDPQGDFIRKFCPELASLDHKKIHDPVSSGVAVASLDYPEPIVDYKAMRQKTIALFKAL